MTNDKIQMTKSRSKVSIIGAGAVGATLAMRVLESGLADVVLLDIAEAMVKGKALDLLDAAPIVGHERKIKATTDYRDIEGSDTVVITAGLARRPGMTREELLSKNRATVREVSRNLKMRATGAVIVVVTNPLDAMSYEVYRATGFEKEKVMGMAGELDAARFIQLVADELKVPRSSVKTYVLGSHAETMVPIISKTLVSGRPLTELLSAEKIERIVSRVRDRGAEIVSLLGTGSAYYSPSAAVFKMVRAVLNDTKETVVVSAYLDGEYGLKGLFMGVPCRLGRRGIEEVLTLEMSDAEKEALARSSQAIKSSIESS